MAYNPKFKTSLTDREKIVLEWAIDHNCNDWIYIYRNSRDRQSNANESSISTLASNWKNSNKIKAYAEQYRISSFALREELDKRALEAKRAKSKENSNEIESFDRSIEEHLIDCQRELRKISDPKERTQMQFKIIELKLRLEARNMGADDQKVKRFYIDIRTDGCKNCALYQSQQQKIASKSEHAKYYK